MKKILLALLIITFLGLPLVTYAAGSSGDSCGITNLFSGTCVSYVIGVIAYFFLELASALMWLAGVLLNLALYYGVIDFAKALGNTAGIGVGWGVMRDIGNIVLIFGFVFIGIATILGMENYGVKKSLPMLLLFALLLNFSLFVSQVIIDTSNLFSTAIYSGIAAPTASAGACSTSSLTNASQCFANSGLAGAVANELGIGTAFNNNAWNALQTNASAGAIIMILSTIFVLIAAVVFFAAAIMLIIRIVVLAILMVLSPIGFAGMVLPPLHKYASQWWNMLLAQSFFVPVYLLLTLIGLKIGQGVIAASAVATGSNSRDLAGALATGGADTTGIFITFAIIIGFLIFALMAAKQMGAMGADFAVSKAGSFAFGTTGFVARRTVGRGFNYAAKRLEKNPWARKTFIGGLALRTLDKGAKGSFDFRTPGAGLSEAAGIKLGKPQVGGYKKIEDDVEKERLAYLKRLKMTPEEEAEAAAANTAVGALKKQQAKELKPLTDELEDQRNALAAAKKAGNAEEIKEEQGKLRMMRDTYDRLKEQQEAVLKRQEDIAKAAGEKVAADYAKYLEKPLPPVFQQIYAFSAGPGGDALAAKKIRKDLKKSTEEKELDGIRALVAKVDAPKKEETEENIH